ncbi:hypothetical protein EJV47_16855 [Hymenobacter gummosus]|uniref:Uncharacterized protein n=1 Tax=Hymenobacter gummosus TaxID=1776032 RepID=A0A3S0HLQ0_9BACT|nr:hypothetical protein [Hymenobacter gummosus]RTQ48107.1 hypothetical protein EJV47_16855 [Hymenobacter gummosus]
MLSVRSWFAFRPCHLLLLGLLLPAGTASAQTPTARLGKVKPYPAGKDFNQIGSDARAVALADSVMQAMGGYEAWQQARFIGWEFFGEQYQVWDKQTNDFRWQKGDVVLTGNLNSRNGKAYRAGQDISETEEGKKLLSGMYATWANNSWWLLMPFKMKDSGVKLLYKGPGRTMQGAPAQVVQMTFENVGVTPNNRYELYISPRSYLVEEWAFYRNAADTAPSFRRQWSGYARYGGLLLAADRTDGKDGRRLNHLAVTPKVPAGYMLSPQPQPKLP